MLAAKREQREREIEAKREQRERELEEALREELQREEDPDDPGWGPPDAYSYEDADDSPPRAQPSHSVNMILWPPRGGRVRVRLRVLEDRCAAHMLIAHAHTHSR